MAVIANTDSQQEFARALGNALWRFLDGRMRQSEAAKLLGLQGKNGEPRRSRLNSYFHDSAKGTRTEASARILYLACTRLPGFYFDYAGYRLKAIKLNGRGARLRDKSVEQLAFSFHRNFELANEAGNVDVRVKKPSGRIEVVVSLDAKASYQH
jgi:hypothetical protein